MLQQLKSWLKRRFSSQRYPSDDQLPPIVPKRRKSDAHAANLRKTHASIRNGNTLTPTMESKSSRDDTEEATIESRGPGKNVLIRNKYVREDTGTHETLKILDDDMIDSGEVSGIDPYNTGGFDRSKNWDNRFRK